MLHNINKDILRLAVPSILANITIPLVGIVDTAIVGHLGDAAVIGGIAIGTMLFDLLYWNFGFLRIGTSGLTAQAYGKGQRDKVQGTKDDVRCTKVPVECREVLAQSMSLVMMATLFVWAIQWFFVTAVLAIVPCSEGAASVAREYFFIRIWAAPATLSLFTMKGWFIGMQDTKSPMAVDILVNVVNMGASYGLAVYTPLGIAGVAWGTLYAQYSGLILAALIMAFKYNIVHIGLREMREAMKGPGVKRMLSLNRDLFIRSLCFMVVYVGFTSLASRYGDTELAVSSILMKFFMFFSFFVDGFAYAGEAMVGKEFGQRTKDNGQWTMDDGQWTKDNGQWTKDDGQRTKDKGQWTKDNGQWTKVNSVVRSLFHWAIGVGVVFTVLYAVFGNAFIAMMTSDNEVLEASKQYIGWLIAMPIVSALAFMWDGVYVGATAGKQIRNAMIWAAVGFVVAYVATFGWAGAQALYIAYFAHLIARVVYLTKEWKY